ncbi:MULTISPECIES: hypothetical protein [Mesorhizobium]|uniref:hypothetical protein n=1 Tax=Mesorhizobium sp. TaxID=1871066 RepID=UPI000AE7F764|nr:MULTISPECIES: hypothetical protein [Mesorhizobium]
MSKIGVNLSFEHGQYSYLAARATSGQRSISSVVREIVQDRINAEIAGKAPRSWEPNNA